MNTFMTLEDGEFGLKIVNVTKSVTVRKDEWMRMVREIKSIVLECPSDEIFNIQGEYFLSCETVVHYSTEIIDGLPCLVIGIYKAYEDTISCIATLDCINDIDLLTAEMDIGGGRLFITGNSVNLFYNRLYTGPYHIKTILSSLPTEILNDAIDCIKTIPSENIVKWITEFIENALSSDYVDKAKVTSSSTDNGIQIRNSNSIVFGLEFENHEDKIDKIASLICAIAVNHRWSMNYRP